MCCVWTEWDSDKGLLDSGYVPAPILPLLVFVILPVFSGTGIPAFRFVCSNMSVSKSNARLLVWWTWAKEAFPGFFVFSELSTMLLFVGPGFFGATNDWSLETLQSTWPGCEDQLSAIAGMINVSDGIYIACWLLKYGWQVNITLTAGRGRLTMVMFAMALPTFPDCWRMALSCPSEGLVWWTWAKEAFPGFFVFSELSTMNILDLNH